MILESAAAIELQHPMDAQRVSLPFGNDQTPMLLQRSGHGRAQLRHDGDGKTDMATRFEGFDWKTEEEASKDGFQRAGRPRVGPIHSQGDDTGHLATYELPLISSAGMP